MVVRSFARNIDGTSIQTHVSLGNSLPGVREGDDSSVESEEMWSFGGSSIESGDWNDKQFARARAIQTRSVKRLVNLENKTKITNESNRDIEVVISHHEVEITFSAKGELGVDVCNIAKLGGGINETKKYAPRKPERTVILAGDTVSFDLPHKDYYLTIMSSDPSKGFVVHESNRRVLSKENWTFEQQDLTKVLRQSKTVFSNNSDRDIIVILSYREVSASAAATNIRMMVGINTLETEDHTAMGMYVILPNTTESVNISEQNFFITTLSEDPMLGHIFHESNRSVACKDGYSFTQNYLKKNLGSSQSRKKSFWFF